jgi:hypothetical protein
MKFLVILCLVATILVAAAIYLPWWGFLGLIFLIIAPLAFFAWKIMRTIKREIVPALKKVAEHLPRAQERLCNLSANESFRGNGFAFAFPLPCEVSQTVIDDLEALILKPALGTGAAQGIMVVSTIPAAELKTKVNDQLDAVFEQVQAHIASDPGDGKGLAAGDFLPIAVGDLSGERRTFEAVNDGKSIRGETVYLGQQNFSVGWAVVGPTESFDPTAERFRELAALVKRVEEPKTIDVPAVGK